MSLTSLSSVPADMVEREFLRLVQVLEQVKLDMVLQKEHMLSISNTLHELLVELQEQEQDMESELV